jgi:hypothetical protein
MKPRVGYNGSSRKKAVGFYCNKLTDNEMHYIALCFLVETPVFVDFNRVGSLIPIASKSSLFNELGLGML